MLIICGVNLFHTQVEEIIHNINLLSPNYRLVVDRKSAMDTVKVEVEVVEGTDINNKELSILFENKIKSTIGLSMQVDLKNPNTIARSQGGKLSRILDNRQA